MFSILIPHFKSKITAYSVAKFIEHAQGEDVEIIVIDNSYPHDSIKLLAPFKGNIKIFTDLSGQISSHGVAYDRVIPYLSNQWFICAESDSFPVKPYLQYLSLIHI